MANITKTLRKTIRTLNHNYALSQFRLYNSSEWPDHFATIFKHEIKEGENKGKIEYVISVYELYEQSF